MNTYTITFFGHRQIENLSLIEHILEKHLKNLFFQYEYLNFLVGRNGDFDQAVSATVRKLKRPIRDDNSTLSLLLAYPTEEYLKNQTSFEAYCDEIEICHQASQAHFKRAITMRNQQMIDRADLVIVYNKRHSGGTYQALTYAQKQKKPIINLFDEEKTAL